MALNRPRHVLLEASRCISGPLRLEGFDLDLSVGSRIEPADAIGSALSGTARPSTPRVLSLRLALGRRGGICLLDGGRNKAFI
jgi:hypothetical protein